jgi:hypothetical protein
MKVIARGAVRVKRLSRGARLPAAAGRGRGEQGETQGRSQGDLRSASLRELASTEPLASSTPVGIQGNKGQFREAKLIERRSS